MAGRAKKAKRNSSRSSKPSSPKKKALRRRKVKRQSNAKPASPQNTLAATAPTAPAAARSGEARIDRLSHAIQDVRVGARTSARTTKLLAGGTAKMAQKVIEEAAEVGIEAIRGDRKALIGESADLIYNLVVLWTEHGIAPADVWQEMDSREALLGMAEKLPKVE